MPAFVGLDLAWTAHRESGLCVLACEDGHVRLAGLRCLVATPAAFAGIIAAHGPDVVAAIDAPLVVGPARQTERLLARHFGRYRASAHAASLDLLERTGRMAGPHLAAELAARSFSLDPLALTPRAGGRFAFEVYPHAAHVVWFDLDERIRYKRKRNRGVDLCRVGLRELQLHLRALLEAELPLVAEALAPTLDPHAVEVRGIALKRLEDQLDAITCAVAACRAWRDGLAPGDVIGAAPDGYIAVPGLARDPRFHLPGTRYPALRARYP